MNELEYTYKFLKENYDYLWLKTRLRLGKNSNPKTLITGSSHALNGIDVYCFDKAINASMHSQDLYYDFLCAKEILQSNAHESIRRCYIVMGYYIAYQDLSRGVGVGREMISKIYYPIFKDTRHWDDSVEHDLWSNIVWDNKYCKCEIEGQAEEMLLQRMQYYSDLSIRISPYKEKWSCFSHEEKEAYARKRANDHNKFIKYENTFVENKEILKDYLALLNLYNIKPIIVIPPFTDAYNYYVNKDMKETVCKMIGNYKNISWIDFNNTGLFGDDDFVDTDHLNGRGAYKMSRILIDMYEG